MATKITDPTVLNTLSLLRQMRTAARRDGRYQDHTDYGLQISRITADELARIEAANQIIDCLDDEARYLAYEP